MMMVMIITTLVAWWDLRFSRQDILVEYCAVQHAWGNVLTWSNLPLTYRPPYRPDGGRKHLWNVGQLLRDYTAQYPRRLSSWITAYVHTSYGRKFWKRWVKYVTCVGGCIRGRAVCHVRVLAEDTVQQHFVLRWLALHWGWRRRCDAQIK
jgi:hypothetical protein